jgi:hypothetical protein
MLMPFIEQDELFTLGFECGQIWELCELGKSFDKKLIHTKNTKQISMIMNRYSCVFEIEKYDDTWGYLTVIHYRQN